MLTEIVAGLLAGTLTRPVPTVGQLDGGTALFYPGMVNCVQGTSGCGKSWTVLAACAQEIAAGAHVFYIDLEADAAVVVGRMLDLGADPQAVVERFHYINPDVRLGGAAPQLLHRITDTAPSLVVIDSTGESMALEGDKPNDDDDTVRWFRRLPTPIARLGPATVVVDHMTKVDETALYASGSHRKRGAITGASYTQITVEEFAKGKPGSAKLICSKDRHGTYSRRQKVAMLDVRPAGGGGVELTLRATADQTDGGETFRPTAIMERVSFLLEQAAEPMSLRGVVKDPSIKGRDEIKTIALNVLVAEGYVARAVGARRAQLHTSARRYRQHDDPRSDRYERETVSERKTVSDPRPSDCLSPLKGGRQGDSHSPSPGDSRETVGDSRQSTPNGLIGKTRDEIAEIGAELLRQARDCEQIKIDTPE